MPHTSLLFLILTYLFIFITVLIKVKCNQSQQFLTQKFNIARIVTDYYSFRTSIYSATCHPSTIHNFTHLVRLNRLLELQLRFPYIYICLLSAVMLHHSSVFVSEFYRPCPFRVWDVSFTCWWLPISEEFRNAYLKTQNLRKHLFCLLCWSCNYELTCTMYVM
jgi:hypothetical protein